MKKEKKLTTAEIMFERRSDVWAGLNTIHELFPLINLLQDSLDTDKPIDKYRVKSVLDGCKTILLYGGGLIEDWLYIEVTKNES